MDMELLGPLVAWPSMLLAAWLAGEWVFRRWNLPRVCAYAVVGLVLGGTGLSQNLASHAAQGFMANVALALTLFELGYRINPRWFRHNPWVLAAGIAQAVLTFGAVFWVAGVFALPIDHRLVLAALCVASSPAAIMRVTHELGSAGQVTERLLHLCALNCLVAVLLLRLVVGYWHLETSGELGKAAFNSIYVIGLSLVAGAAFGVVAPLLNRIATSSQSTTVTFALLVLLLTGLAQSLHLSPLLAALAFGVVARERRIMLSHAQRNFGALGDVLSVFLFVFVGSLLSWSGLLASLLLGIAVLLTRTASHTLVNLSLAHVSGTTFRKGALTGLALMPMAAFALLLLEESRLYGFDLARDSLPAIVGLLVLLDVLGPLATQRALMLAGESHPEGG
ncbi:MAG TPA: cation:proton antiporter [Burkholderiaceae bacterium]|nr:cation:proton antiporter [Burkholderiaceae bacterium]